MLEEWLNKSWSVQMMRCSRAIKRSISEIFTSMQNCSGYNDTLKSATQA